MSKMTPFSPGFLAAYAFLFVAASSPGPAVGMLLGIGLSQVRAPSLWATRGVFFVCFAFKPAKERS